MSICPYCESADCHVAIAEPDSAMYRLSRYCDAAITAEYYRRVRAKKAASVAAGGKTGGWPKGRKRKLIANAEGVVTEQSPDDEEWGN